MKRAGLLLLKVGVTLVLLMLLLESANLPLLSQALARLDMQSMGAAAALVSLQCLLLGWRWHRIVNHLGGRLGALRAVQWTLIGIFFNQALPSSVGGDAVRIWLLHRQGSAPGLALSSVLVERVSGLVVLGVLVSACAGALLLAGSGGAALLPLLAVGPVLAVGAALILVLGAASARLLPAPAADQIRLLLSSFARLGSNGTAAAEALALGAAASSAGLLASWVLGRAMEIDAGPATYIALVGGAVLLTVLPISFGGWGLREASVVALFGTVGAAREPVLAMSLAWGLLPVVLSAPFAAMWWLSGRQRP